MYVSLSLYIYIYIHVYMYKHILAYSDIQSGYHMGKVTIELSNQRTDLGEFAIYILGIRMSMYT